MFFYWKVIKLFIMNQFVTLNTFETNLKINEENLLKILLKFYYLFIFSKT